VATDREADAHVNVQPVRARRRWRRWVLLGAVAFVLMLLVAAFFAPAIVSRYGVGWGERWFAANYAGHLELDGLALGWGSEGSLQTFELQDPDGAVVLRGGARFPSLGALIAVVRGGTDGPLVAALDIEHAEYRILPDGTNNFARALDPRRTANRKAKARAKDTSADFEFLLPEISATVDAQRVVYLDERPGAAPGRVELVNVNAALQHGAPRTASGSDPLSAAGIGPLSLKGAAVALLPGAARLEFALDAPLPSDDVFERPPPTASFVIDGVAVAQWDTALGLAGRLLALLGDSAQLNIHARAAIPSNAQLSAAASSASATAWVELAEAAEGAVDLEFQAPRASASGRLALREGRFAVESPLCLSAAADAAVFDALVPAEMRSGEGALAALRFVETGRFEIEFTRLGFGIAGLFAVDPVPALAADLALDGRAQLSGATWLSGDGVTVPVEGLEIDVAVPGGGRPTLRAKGQLATAPAAGAGAAPASAKSPGRVEATVVLTPLAQLLPGLLAQPRVLPPLDVEAELTGLSTAFADTVLGSDGLLNDVLGPRVDASVVATGVVAEPGALAGVVRIRLVSELAELETTVRLLGDRIVAEPGQPLDLAFALTPLSSPRVVGNLVPLVASVRSVDPNERAVFTLSNFSLPLDGDLSKLSGEIVLDAGEVMPSLFPGAPQLLGALAPNLGATHLGPYRFAVEAGVVRYSDLILRIDGRSVAFDGLVELDGGRIDVRTKLPLSAIGGEVGDWLNSARHLLDPNLPIPVRIEGTWKDPRLRLDASAEDALRGAAKGALERAAEDLLKKQAEKGIGDLFRRLGGG